MANAKWSAQGAITAPVNADETLVIDDTGGTPISKRVTLANLSKGLGAATDAVQGAVELATDAETNTGTATDRATTPANITAWTGSTAIVTAGALDAGSITSNFGTIDNGASAITSTGDITGGGIHVTGDTAASDLAALGYTAAEGLILTGQGSTNDLTLKNDADTVVLQVPTGGTVVNIPGSLTIDTVLAVTQGGTGVGTSTGTGNTVLSSSPTLVTPALGTPASGVMTNVTGIPVAALANGTDGELITWAADATAATIAVGTATHVLTSNGVGVAPTFQAAGGASYPDDTPLTLGTGSDVNLLWETADADAHYFSVEVSGSNNMIINADTGTDWTHAASTNPTLWIQSADAATVADYVKIYHDQTRGRIETGAGSLCIGTGTPDTATAPGALYVTQILEVDGSAVLQGGATFSGNCQLLDDLEFYIGTGADSTISWQTAQTPDSWMFGVSTQSAAMIVCENGNRTGDYAHPNQTNPTIFVQSTTAAGTATDEWISITHNVTAAVIDSGSGGIVMNKMVIGTQGTDLASATNVTLTTTGSVFELTGTTKVDLISNVGVQDGTQIVLVANESVVIDNATATSTTNITILLNGAADYSMTAGDTLTLVLCTTTAGGQGWRETARSVN